MSRIQGLKAVLCTTAALAFSLFAAFSAGAQTIRYVHTDGLGSVVLTTDKDRNVVERSEYEPYGSLLNRPLADGPGYTGHAMDATTGLTYMQQRYYDPTLGRFLSVDPIVANASSGANFNRYFYAGNNPYAYIDPDGRCKTKPGTKTCENEVASVPVSNMEAVKVTASKEYNGSWFSDRNWITGDGSLTDFESIGHDLIYPLMDMPEGAPFKAAGAGLFWIKGISGFSRELRIADLGLKGTIKELNGVYTIKNGVATIRIDMIRGNIKNPMQIIENMASSAKANGATSLRIEGTIANERLYDVLAKRYGLTSAGATDAIVIPLK